MKPQNSRRLKMATVKAYNNFTQGSTKLSSNFKVKEFACNDGSGAVLIADELVELLQQIRDYFGKPVTINSGYRNNSYNASVGGADGSQHKLGTAADIRVSGKTPKQVASYVETLMPNTGGIGIYSSFTHVDVRNTKSRWNG